MEYKITIGSKYEHEFSFLQKDVIKFADASGDNNPIHLDPAFAAKTIFKRTIVHGFLGGSVFSKVFGTLFPGEGTIYLKQDLAFYKPMFTNNLYRAIFEVLDVVSDKNRAIVKTTILNDQDEIVIDGEAIIKHYLIS